MKQVILLLVTVLAYAVASDTIRPLFETSSIVEYDQWLWRHRNEYPRFRPVRVRVGEERGDSGWTRLTAVFLTDSGTELVRHVYPDSWQGSRIQQVSNINVIEAGDYSVVYRRGAGTAYDRRGRKLFDSDRGIFPRFNLWFRDSESSESTQVLNDDGKVIGMLPHASMWTATGSGDTLIAAVSRSGTIVFDRRARIRWRDNLFGAASRIAAISPDGRKVAIATRDSVGLHDLITGSNKVLGPDTAAAASAEVRSIVWSDDSRRVAVRYLVGRDSADSVLLRVLTRDARVVAPPRTLVSDYVDNMFWMGDTVVLVASPGEPDAAAGKMCQRGLCRAFAMPLNGDIRTWMVPGRFGRRGVWYQQGRSLAYVDKDMGYFAVFKVPVK